MLRFLTDEHIHGGIARGIRRRQPEIDIVRVQEVGLTGASDSMILQWASDEDCIVISEDRQTMISDANERVIAGLPMPGLLVIRPHRTVGEIIDEILLIANCSSPDDWRDRVEHIPL